MALQPLTRADEVTIRLMASPSIDADAERLIAASPNPDSLRSAFNGARSSKKVRWYVLNPDGSSGASGETPSEFALPVTATYRSADFNTEFRIEYKFRNGSGHATQKGCVRIFNNQTGFGSRGAPKPRGR